MAVIPGSATQLNKIVGISCLLPVTAAELASSSAEQPLVPNILLTFPDGKVALTDGVTPVKDLSPLVDQILNETEKLMLTKTFSGANGTYEATEGGALVLSADGRMAAAQLPADVYDADQGKIKLDALPATVRAGVCYVADIDARDALPLDSEGRKTLVFVIDATADATVTQGAALYAWTDVENENFDDTQPEDPDTNPKTVKDWVKIAETESLDINVEELKPNYENIQKAGAVMYDHPIVINEVTFTEVAAMMQANPIPTPVITPPSVLNVPTGGFSMFSGETLTIESSPFESNVPNDVHVGTEWIVSTDEEGNDIVERHFASVNDIQS